jgi:hypothetical protein
MKPSEILRRAKERIGTPDRWCKGVLARDARGSIASTDEDAACQWCASGAILAETGKVDSTTRLNSTCTVWDAFRAAGIPYSIPAWNDAPERTHAEVLSAFDRAITLAEEAGQ